MSRRGRRMFSSRRIAQAVTVTNGPGPTKTITAREFRQGLGVPQLERAVQNEVLQYLELHRIFAWRQSSNGRPMRLAGGGWTLLPSEAPGVPDVLGVFPWGQMFMFELKRENGGRLRYRQASWLLRAMSETAALCLVPRGVDEVAPVIDPLMRWWRETDGGLYRVAMFQARVEREGKWLQDIRERTMDLCQRRLELGPEKTPRSNKERGTR